LDIIFCHVIILSMFTVKHGKSVSVICSVFVHPQSCKNSRTFGCSWRSSFTKICLYIAFQPFRGWGSQFTAKSKQRPRFIPGQSIWCLWWIKLYWDRLFLGVQKFSPFTIVLHCTHLFISHWCSVASAVDSVIK